ncbi:purine and uridine phosphorylase [Aspergillus tetrazonus]
MRPKSRNDFTIAIICALPLEADAVEALFDEHYDRLGKHYGKQEGDANAYVNGRIDKCQEWGREVQQPLPLTCKSATRASSLLWLLVFAGVAPSPPEYGDIFLGDVIISDSVIEYDLGRQYPGGFSRKSGAKEALGRPSREIRTLLNSLRAENIRSELQSQTQQYLQVLQQRGPKWYHPGVSDVLYRASYLHKHYSHASPVKCSCSGSDLPEQICDIALEKECDELGCDSSQQIRCREVSEAIQTFTHIGSFASADKVMKSRQHCDEIARKEKVIGFEMEGAGVWDNVPCIIIKGVCDYADSHKSKLWQTYAAATGASVAKAFLGYWRPEGREGKSVYRGILRRLLELCPLITSQPVILFSEIFLSPKSEGFVGRSEQLGQLEELLFSPGHQHKIAITGLGGVGKTQIALELAYRTQQSRPECSIYWIPATNFETLQRTYLHIAQQLRLPGVEEEGADVKKLLKDYLCDSSAGQWLLIFDNADDIDLTGSVLFTTRFQKVASKLAMQDVFRVPEMDEARGLELLNERLVDKSLLQDREQAALLLKQLVYLPLAIMQAASYINANRLSTLADYISFLTAKEEEMIDLLNEEFEDDWRPHNTTIPVAATWLISFEQIQRINPLATDILSFMACIEPAEIPESLLPLPLAASRKAWVESIGILEGYAFVTRRPTKSFHLHRLVHLATRNWLRKIGSLSEWTLTTLTRLEEIFPNDDHTNREKWKTYSPHVLGLLGKDEVQGVKQRYELLYKVSMCLLADGRTTEAVQYLEEHCNWHEREYGKEHPDRLASQHELAEL